MEHNTYIGYNTQGRYGSPWTRSFTNTGIPDHCYSNPDNSKSISRNIHPCIHTSPPMREIPLNSFQLQLDHHSSKLALMKDASEMRCVWNPSAGRIQEDLEDETEELIEPDMLPLPTFSEPPQAPSAIKPVQFAINLDLPLVELAATSESDTEEDEVDEMMHPAKASLDFPPGHFRSRANSVGSQKSGQKSGKSGKSGKSKRLAQSQMDSHEISTLDTRSDTEESEDSECSLTEVR